MRDVVGVMLCARCCCERCCVSDVVGEKLCE